MPTDLVGVAFYLMLIIPGVVFAISRERHRPRVKRSAFRETATAVFASAAIFALFVLLVAVASMSNADVRREVVAFLDEPSAYARSHFDWFAIIGTVVLATAGVISWFVGSERVHALTFGRWQDDPDRESWGYVFNRIPDALNFAGVQLRDGTWIEGYVDTYGNVGEEGEPKALTLLGRISIRPPGAELTPFAGETIVIKDADIAYLSVSYVSDTVSAGRREVASDLRARFQALAHVPGLTILTGRRVWLVYWRALCAIWRGRLRVRFWTVNALGALFVGAGIAFGDTLVLGGGIATLLFTPAALAVIYSLRSRSGHAIVLATDRAHLVVSVKRRRGLTMVEPTDHWVDRPRNGKQQAQAFRRAVLGELVRHVLVFDTLVKARAGHPVVRDLYERDIRSLGLNPQPFLVGKRQIYASRETIRENWVSVWSWP
ncbi:DUF6338 family protein [Microbacterium laevaniformans]|uniref:DUF6338 family protein n=1 Tax=Microbacterium laevaniformans TaxID=36807 RepID=UPI003644A079